MAMASSVRELIRSRVRHASGEVPEIIVPKTCIGGVAEAADCAELFQREGVGVSLTVTPCWCYGSETMDMDRYSIKAIWGFNGTERPGAVYLAATLAGHAQKGLPCFGIYGRDVQDAGDDTIPFDVEEKILRFVRAGLAAATMRGTSYLAIGGVSMGIAGSIVDQYFFENYLGMRVETVDMTVMLHRIQDQIYDLDEFEKALSWVRENCQEGQDLNAEATRRSRSQKDDDWSFCTKCAIIARDLMIGNPRLAEMGYKEQAEGHNALAAGFQGQRQWTDAYPNGDFLEAMLCSSFDWNGVRQPFVMATENDSLNAVSMLFGHLLTGTAQLFSDVRTFWSPEAVERVTGYQLNGAARYGLLHLINSGPSALDWTGAAGGVLPWWDMNEAAVSKCLEATQWCASDLGYFPGGGWSTDFTTIGGLPVTMCRLNLVAGLGPVMQLVEGWTVDLPSDVHDALDRRTNPTWPTTWFAPRLGHRFPFESVYDVMNAWGANHGAVCIGHIGADLITLCSMLRIPVEMHNLETEQLFRPAVWSRFGSLDPVGADYRACAALGPLYS